MSKQNKPLYHNDLTELCQTLFREMFISVDTSPIDGIYINLEYGFMVTKKDIEDLINFISDYGLIVFNWAIEKYGITLCIK